MSANATCLGLARSFCRRVIVGLGAGVVAMSIAPGPGLAQESGPGAAKDFTAFKIIVDRNIFDPNRRPRVASGPAPTIVDWFALTGTLTYSKGTFAVFDGSGSDYHKVLESGGRIAGYTLSRIGADSAELSAGTNRVELRVGMQMRRNEDGTWEPAEASSPIAASTSSRRHSGHSDFSSARVRSHNAPAAAESQPVVADQADAGGTAPEAVPTDNSDSSAVAPAADAAGNSDPNDPVARMMRRRQQETSGSENNNPNQ